MSGDFLAVWARSWEEIWLPLSRSSKAPRDFFIEMVVGIGSSPKPPRRLEKFPDSAFDEEGNLANPEAISVRNQYNSDLEKYRDELGAYETALSSTVAAEEFFKGLHGNTNDESSAISFLERSYLTIVDMEREFLAEEYVSLVSSFVDSYNLRYEIRGRFALSPTIHGMFSKMIEGVKRIASEDAHVRLLMSEFEEAFGDLKVEQSQSKIKTCLQKQFNLLEALGRKYPGVTAGTLGAICGQLDWPHVTIREVGVKLYGFRSDYPGLGHGGNPDGMLRQLEMKDFLSLSLMLASLTPYLVYNLDSGRCYCEPRVS